jgi:predicted amino acid dehydrogenase
MTRAKRIIVSINMVRHAAPRDELLSFDDTSYLITEHNVGWDFAAATELVRRFDGYADALCLNGIRTELGVGSARIAEARCAALIHTARDTPVYVGDALRNLFAQWTISTLVSEQPELLLGQRVLFHAAIASPHVTAIAEAGAQVESADALMLMGLPVKLRGIPAMERFLRSTRPLLRRLSDRRLMLYETQPNDRRAQVLGRWLGGADVFVTFQSILSQLGDLRALHGKDLILDFATDALRARLAAVGVRNVLELKCRSATAPALHTQPFPVLEGIIDLQRQRGDNTQPWEAYTIQQIERLQFTPHRLDRQARRVRRCAYIVHSPTPPHSDADPRPWQRIRQAAGRATAAGRVRMPLVHLGCVRGVRSRHDGQEVICDVFSLAATSADLMRMRPETVYRALVRGLRRAERRGALIAGLGDSTGNLGDAGITVNRRAPIPVTTGSAYAVATALWAARTAVERLGLISGERTANRLAARVMIVGASGSMGRVASLLTSLAFSEVVLVGSRPDRLLELCQEVRAFSPETTVRVATHPDRELPDSDLVVIANATGGRAMNIAAVKPGAVVCDAARPVSITAAEATVRPDVLVVESGEVTLPGADVRFDAPIGARPPSVLAGLAETLLLTMEGRYEPFSLSRTLSWQKVKEIYKLGLKHGVTLAGIRGPAGLITDADIDACRAHAHARGASAPAREQSA